MAQKMPFVKKNAKKNRERLIQKIYPVKFPKERNKRVLIVNYVNRINELEYVDGYIYANI
jgi:glutamine cyclotransferase